MKNFSWSKHVALSLCIPILLLTACGSSGSSSNTSTDMPTDSDKPSSNIRTIVDSSIITPALIALNQNTDPNGDSEMIGIFPEPSAESKITFKQSSGQFIRKDHLSDQQMKVAKRILNKIKIKTDDHMIRTEKKQLPRIQAQQNQAPITTLKYDSDNISIYVDENFTEPINWTDIGDTFNIAYNRVTQIFGIPTDIDANNRTIVFLFDFPTYLGDGFTFVAGLFNPGDLTDNRGEIVYINTRNTSSDFLKTSTFSHELTHLIVFGNRQLKTSPALPELDTWINEGLAEAAEIIGTQVPSDLNDLLYFRFDPENKFKNGHPLIRWEAEYADYVLAYLFFEYCRVHSGGTSSVFHSIASASQGDYNAVFSSMTDHTGNFATFQDLLIGFNAAITFNGDDIYGYGNQKEIFNIKGQPGTNITTLRPGGSVFVYGSENDVAEFEPINSGRNLLFIKVIPE